MFDVAVVGAGFGGMATALGLCERGASVVLFEALNYPGGCASTFRRDGYQFEAGATLFSGLGEEQLFGRIIRRYGLDVTIDWLDPVVELRTSRMTLPVPRDRERFVASICEASPGREADVRAFFAMQRRVADALWQLFEDPSLLPPLNARSVLTHVLRAPQYLPLVSLLGAPLGKLLTRHRVREIPALYAFLRAVCQITVQCDPELAEAPFALAAMDYYFRGTGHVRHGIGSLAQGLLRAVREASGEVRLAERVRALTKVDGGYELRSRKGAVRARKVVLNLLPQDALHLLGAGAVSSAQSSQLCEDVKGGWGAVMLYRVLRASEDFPSCAHHVELVHRDDEPFTHGNHVFVSLSGEHDTGRAGPFERTFTASTHVPVSELRELSEPARAERVRSIQEAMRLTIAERAPELTRGVVHELTASPRTFERFTGRSEGLVGGVPRVAGLKQYMQLGPTELAPGVYLAGDSVFLGQSTLATALSGMRTAESISRAL